MTGEVYLFVLPEKRETDPPAHILALFGRMGLEGWRAVQGATMEALALTASVHFSSVDVLEGLIEQFGCGFGVTAAWGPRPTVRSSKDQLKKSVSEIGHAAPPIVSIERPPLPVTALPVSHASRDRLIAAGLDALPLLAQKTERELLDAGFVSLDELLTLAKLLWSSSGAGFASVSRQGTRLHVDLELLLPIRALGFSPHVNSVLGRLNVTTLADVTRERRAVLLADGLSESEAASIDQRLWRRGLIDPRVAQYARDLAAMFAFELSEARPHYESVEEELNDFLRHLDNEQNGQIAARCFGWDGRGGARDVRVAEEFGLSRERIRQVRERVLERFRLSEQGTPVLEAALRFASTRVPCIAADLEVGLVAAGFCKRPFRLEGLAHAARERRIPASFAVVEERAGRLAVPPEDEAAARVLLLRSHGKAPLSSHELQLHPATHVSTTHRSDFERDKTAAPTTSVPREPGTADEKREASDSTWNLAEWMLTRARALRLLGSRHPWSLIELRWEGGVLADLRQWGRVARIGAVRELKRERDFGGVRIDEREAVALVFLGYTVAVGRQEAHEGELWPFVCRSLSEGLQERFFTQGSMLRPWIRDALEETCPRLGLRHVFGQDGVQAWIRTVFLQFGVSEAGWQRLPWWLSGHQVPVTVDDLLDPKGSLHSESFTGLWKALLHARFGLGKVDQLQRKLQELGSPWLDGADAHRVAVAALARPEIARVSDEQDEEGALCESRLRWTSGGPPRFEVQPVADPPGQKAGQYLLVLEGIARVPILWDGQGGWRTPSGPILIEPKETSVPLELLFEGCSVLRDTLRFCDADEEVLLFDLSTGRELDAYRAVPLTRAVAVLTRSDLAVRPEPPVWVSAFGGAWKLWRLPDGLPAETEVLLGADVLWTPAITDSAPPSPQGRVWIAGTGRWGETTKVRIQMQGDFEPISLRLGARVYAVNSEEGKYVASLVLDPAIGPLSRARVISVVAGRRTVVPVQNLLRPWGMARRSSGGLWSSIAAGDVLDVANLDHTRLRISAPPNWGVPSTELAILEGNTFQARPKSAMHGFGASLHGLGDSLLLCRGPYNRVDTPVTLAASLVTSGVVGDAIYTEGALRFRLRQAIDATDEHFVWVWGEGREAPQAVAKDRIHYDGRAWWVVECAPPLACALSYRGLWLGAHYIDSRGPAEMASLAGGTTDWRSLALWLRWWRAPVLAEPLRAAVERRALQEAAPTLSVWLSNPAGLPEGLRLPADDASWPTVVQHFFWRWRPSPLQALSLVDALVMLSGDPVRDLVDGWKGFEDLLAVHPVLLALIARDGARALYPKASSQEMARILLGLRDRIAGVEGRSGSDWRLARKRLLESAATSMHVDSGFIDPGLLREARQLASGDQPVHDNLRVALVVGPLRRFIAAVLVSEVASELN